MKWSLDRAVSVGGFPTFQMKAGSLEKPEQFVVVDDNTIRVDFLRKDKLTIPDLAVIVPKPEGSSVRESGRIIGLLDSETIGAERGEGMGKF